MEILIRRMCKDDAPRVTELTRQLGYSLSLDQVLQNISSVLTDQSHDAFVAVDGNQVIGWIGVKHAFQIEAAPFCEIHGLVVDDQSRNCGVGKMLITKAKQWGKEKGNDKLRLRCNIKRTETHLFYEHLGFTETKQQKVYELAI